MEDVNKDPITLEGKNFETVNTHSTVSSFSYPKSRVVYT